MIKNFTIYGERCSGTNFLKAIFTGQSDGVGTSGQKHNGISDLEFVSDYGWKHWFGFSNEKIKQEGDETLFLCIVRDCYDWIYSLYTKKHHVPPINHTINNFLLGEWYSIDHKKTSPTYGKENMGDRDMDTQERYKNIFHLRSKKLNYLYNVMPTLAKNYYFLRYEDLCQYPDDVFLELSKKFDLKFKGTSDINTKPSIGHTIYDKYKKIIDENIDWDMENCIGYKKR
jgi:hypothetical protein